MTDERSTKQSPDRNEWGTLLHLLEVCSAASPAGAAAVHLVRTEQEVLSAAPSKESEARTSIFLLQLVPLVFVLDDLRRIKQDLPAWIGDREDAAFHYEGFPTRTPHGFVLEAGNRWRLDIHPNGYIGLAAFSRHRQQVSDETFFGLARELSPLPGMGDLCNFVAKALDLPADATWRIRATVLNGPAILLGRRSDRSPMRGVLPSTLTDISGVPTTSVSDRFAALRGLLESLCSQEDYF